MWIGWLRNRLHDDPDSVPQPVLAESANINFGKHGGYDAVLEMNELGQPDLENPMIPAWPEAEFIVGNPPFIGKGAEMRRALGAEYVEALWNANPRVPRSADFVMQWWDRAAHSLGAKDSPLIRFGFVTTNSITQEFSRRVISNYLAPVIASDAKQSSANVSPRSSAARDDEDAEKCLSLVMAIPDHPWTKATKDAAAVRIAMTVAERGEHQGELREVTKEIGIATDEPKIELERTHTRINADLSAGADANSARRLQANEGLSCNGIMLAGQGFWVDRSQALYLATQDASPIGSSPIIRRHIGGSELTQRPRDGFVIDFFGLGESEARQNYPAAYQWVLTRVKPERDENRRQSFRDRWWVFGEPRRTFRPALRNLSRFIGTTRTAKHRTFQLIDGDILPNHEVVAIASDDAFVLGVLSSRIHLEWALHAGGTLEDRPRYNKASTFDPYPFPDPTPEQRATIAELAEELDATRKSALAETDKLTMTELYNLREKLRSGAPMDDNEQRRATKARAAIVTACTSSSIRPWPTPTAGARNGEPERLARPRSSRGSLP